MDPEQRRILIDLTKAYGEKIRRAAAHMQEMCEFSDIPHEDMLPALITANLRFVVDMLDLYTDMSAEDFGVTCAEALQARRAISKRGRRSREQA